MELDLTTIEQQISTFDPDTLRSYAKQAYVELHLFHLPPRTAFQVSTVEALGALAVDAAATVVWAEPSLVTRTSFENRIDCVERAAEAVAMLAVLHTLKLRVVKRARALTGSDLVCVRDGEPDNDFHKLEVSGIEEKGNIASRMKTKVEELRNGNLRRPGVAAVVHFQSARVALTLVAA